ncbi:MAG: hypothetical protein ABJB69_06925 [Spartobacteria bacterium]
MVHNNGSGMALSQRKTTVAVLRGILGRIHGGEVRFAKLAGRSPSWVKKVSAGIVPLTEETARILGDATGISFEWLLGPANRRPISGGLSREPYTHKYFEWYRSVKQSGSPIRQCAFSLYEFLPDIIGVGFAAGKKHKAALFMWRLKTFLARLREEFGRDDYAKQITESLLDQKDGNLSLARRGEILTFADLWIVDRDPRGLRFRLPTPVSQRVATVGLENMQIKAARRGVRALSVSHSRILPKRKRKKAS